METSTKPILIVSDDGDTKPAANPQVAVELEAVRWRLIADCATMAAACRTYEELTTALANVLRSDLDATAVAYFDRKQERFDLVSSSAGDDWLALKRCLQPPNRNVRPRVLELRTIEGWNVVALPVRFLGEPQGYLCVARAAGFDRHAHALLIELSRYISPTILNVRNHLRARARLNAVVATVLRADLADETNGVETLRRTVSDLSDIAQAEEGMLPCHPRETNLGGLTRSVLDALTVAARRADVTLDADVSDIYASIDRNLMRRALYNLVLACIEHAPGGHVEVKTSCEPGRVLFEVFHDGNAFPPEMTQSGRFTHYGVGLTFCAHVVARHGGTLDGHDREGGGVRFALMIPVDEELSDDDYSECRMLPTMAIPMRTNN